MTDFDALRAAVVGGDGVVARYPGIIAVAQGPDDAVRRLLEVCREVAGGTPGRALARRLAVWLAGDEAPSDQLRFGTVAATDRGLAVFLSGGVSVLVPELGVTISGDDAAAWADRLIDAPDVPLVLTVNGASTPPGLLAGAHDLRLGVVPGVAVVALAAGASAASPDSAGTQVLTVSDVQPAVRTPEAPAPEPPAPPVEVPVPPAVPQAASAVRPPRRADAILGAAQGVTEPNRPPLDIGGKPARTAPSGAGPAGNGPAPAVEPVDQPPQAQGHLCSRGHLNDPRSHFCVLCGIRMNERTGVLVLGSRPPLGLMVFDDGATYTVDAEYLVGRMPEVDERVRSGALRSILVEDRSGSVSRVHAEIRLDGWDVVLVDSGSSNGTFVAPPGEQAWAPVPPRESRRLVPGTRVRLGGRTFVFESPSGVR